MADMTSSMTSLALDDGEEEFLQVDDVPSLPIISYANCLVRTFLTTSVVKFESMRSTLANIWRPIGGISVTDLGEGMFLFRFYHVVDVDRICDGGPWNFNGHMLLSMASRWRRPVLGHGEAFCPIRLTVAPRDIVFHWDISLRAHDRRPLLMNRWLRDENDGCSPTIKDDGVNCGISFANLLGNYVKRLWDYTKGSIPDRLVELGVGLDAWLAHIKRDRRLTVNDLRKQLVELAYLVPTDEVLHETIDRSRHNHVSELDSALGQYIQDPHDMARVAMEYFHNMFASQSPTDVDRVLQGIVPCIKTEMNASLNRDFTLDEVLVAIKTMSPLKAAGEDGLGALFYQRFWGIVGRDVGRYCIEILNGSHSFSDINHTHIVLIPK
ncbi:hypothetical protein GQ457_01G013910 [Hibiscus cannabinus]